MFHNDCIRKSIDLKDKNITFDHLFCEELVIKGRKSKVYHAKLSYQPEECKECKKENTKHSIVKNGFMLSKIKWISHTRYPTYLFLRKQRFLCRQCGASFLAESLEFEKHCFIARRVKQSVLFEITDATSFKDIAKRHAISSTTVIRTMRQVGNERRNHFKTLPETLCLDEFTSTKNKKGKYSFIYSNASSHKIIDILIDNFSRTIRDHFLRYPLKERLKVKAIVVDMNAGYFKRVKESFPNASVVIDRFHLVQLINRALNVTRIKTMNTYRTAAAKDYRKLKRYWKLFLKESNDLDYQTYHYHRLFKKVITETEIMDYLLSLNSQLKETYQLYQDLLYCSKKNDYEGFKDLILMTKKHELSPSMETSILTLKKHLPRIKNTFQSTLSNGSLEGSINKIKLIKRIAYSYRNFYNYHDRILLSFSDKKIGNENAMVFAA
ncbi:ISL3 family transposase [Enterococcus eurekensis]|uniref:ISL3 family transposase n=1 Tax=Enterococcus eurekensis TaxID=1159753 RepID=A0ABV9M746_9ENTE